MLGFTLENYAGVLDPVVPADRRSARSCYAAITTALCLAAGYPVAYLIGRADERWRNLLLMAVMVPFWTSFLIRTYAWVTILKSEGLLNSLLLAARADRRAARDALHAGRGGRSASSTRSCRS